MTCLAPNERFREARERLHLSVDEAATLCGISAPCLRDLEGYSDDLTNCYSATDLVRFCAALQISATALFGTDIIGAPVSAAELADLIREECRLRKITIDQFEDVVGWNLRDSLEPPQRLLGLSLDGLQWLCRELHLDWRRVLIAL